MYLAVCRAVEQARHGQPPGLCVCCVLVCECGAGGGLQAHLTNYAINKDCENFREATDEFGQDESSKRSVSWLMDWLSKTYGKAKASALWRRVGAVCAKTVISVLPIVRREYKQIFEPESGPQCSFNGSRCVQLIGVDVLLDARGRAWLVECNILPSYATDSPFDAHLKSRLVAMAMNVFKADPRDYSKYKAAQEQQQEQREQQAGLDRIAMCRTRVEAVYGRYAPAKLAKVDLLFSKWKGREEELTEAVERKYSYGRLDMDRSRNLRGTRGGARGVQRSSWSSPNNSEEGESSAAPEDREDGEIEDSVARQERELLSEFDQLWPPHGEWAEHGESWAQLLRHGLEQDSKREQRRYNPLEMHNATEELVLPAIGSSLNQRGGLGWGDPEAMQGGYVPPPAPSEAQVNRAKRLVSGSASTNIVLNVPPPAVKLRVEMKTLEAKNREKETKLSNKCVAVKQNVFDPFANF
eukprot:TRINITY_DN7571_c0_g1_i5.p1 TRINITY_DN7571_c0_g1~~TRINITY_DN7571_c0_g1_i5.p1  ORF type:complete len:468 (+),score=102.25 TRINITY_DN7571_c0_g1_i5:895-2298(+)